jgi:hypothetical protein
MKFVYENQNNSKNCKTTVKLCNEKSTKCLTQLLVTTHPLVNSMRVKANG